MRITIHIKTSFGSGCYTTRDGAYMWIIEATREDGSKTDTLSGTGYEERTTRDRLELLALIEAMSHLKEGTDPIICIEKTNIRSPVEENWIQRWAYDGFNRSQTKGGHKYLLPLKNAELWERLYYQIGVNTLTWTDEHSTYRSYMESQLKKDFQKLKAEYNRKKGEMQDVSKIIGTG